ncbi:MAG: hypothetical protein KDE52_16810 [Calditrichaeota bacterium]|nr:hypothetical protein [Calditrichota bacterium]
MAIHLRWQSGINGCNHPVALRLPAHHRSKNLFRRKLPEQINCKLLLPEDVQ